MTQPQFDPALIERHAEQLYRKADSVRVGSAIVGAALGVVFGAVPVSPLGPYLPIPSTFGMATILLGALVGGFIGYVVGEGRALRIRLQAQMVLFQLQLERNTAAATQAITSAVAIGAPVGAAPAPVAAAQPVPVVAAPAPVVPAPAPVARPAPIAPPEPLIPVQPAAAPVAPPLPIAPPLAQPVPPPVLAPPPVAAPRPPLEAVPPLAEPAPLVAAESLRAAEDRLAPPLLPPLSPSANSGSGA